MTTNYSEQITQSLERLREHQERMAAATAELQASTASATSKDRLVTAKVGPQGQVVSITFHTDGYRAMAPAELSAALVEVLNRARADMGERVIEAMRPFTGLGESLRASMAGGTELDTLLAPLHAMRPPRTDQPVKITAKQEEYDG
jgi:DNA-binding protein YbaB